MAAVSEPAATEVRIGEHRFVVRDLRPHDTESLLRLHVRVFGPGASAAWHEWKYGAGAGLGSGVWQGDELVAHCGGLPRTLWREGRRTGGIQIGDVLVAPEWRGLLTRRGPFFQASSYFYGRHVGGRSGHDIAFGFPSERHMRLGTTLKLLWDAGPIHALTWQLSPQHQATGSWAWRWSPLDPAQRGFDAVVDRTWQMMRAKCSTLVLGERSAAYVRWRFLERPGRTSQLFVLRRPWPVSPVGIAVLDLQGPQAQWLDWIGDPGVLKFASRACAAEAAARGATSMVAWCSPAVAEALRETGIDHQSVTARLGIPRASALSEQELPGLRWWFMGGDTDFL